MPPNIDSHMSSQNNCKTHSAGSTAPTLGISIISWRSWKTLTKTLKSYMRSGLLDCVDRAVVYFQDICLKDIAIAKRFGIEFIGGPNCGIADGMRNAANHLGTDYILFLEDDCPVIVDRFEIQKQLAIACNYLEVGKIDVMRFRSRSVPGEAFSDIEKYLRYYKTNDAEQFVDIKKYRNAAKLRWLRRTFKPYNLHRMKGRSLYVEKSPEKRFPEVIQKTKRGIWICDSSCIDWTNQSIICRRSFFLDVLMPYVDDHPASHTSNGFQSPERPLNCAWWRGRHFKIGQGEGLFTHARYDGSWRKNHPAFVPNVEYRPSHLEKVGRALSA